MATREIILEEQHQIPQQISAFQFHLVGDMTLKQFLQLAGGALVALIIYASGLPTIVKWPLIFISFGLGAALAFLPLEDRPLAKWIFSFFRSIYSPTVFVWQKAAKIPEYFAPEDEAEKRAPVIPIPSKASPLPPPKAIPEQTKLEEQERSFLSKITHLANSTPQVTPAQTVAYGVKPVITQWPFVQKPPGRGDKKRDVVIPGKGRIRVEKKDSRFAGVAAQDATVDVSGGKTYSVAPVLGKGTLAGGAQARFSPEAAPPVPPTQPNIIVGQVVSPDGKIIEAAILEIKDQEGRPVRALKTNKLGHFMIVTPLLSGRYEIATEKEGFSFDPVTLEAKGKIVPPIAIWAKGGQ